MCNLDRFSKASHIILYATLREAKCEYAISAIKLVCYYNNLPLL